MPAAKGFPYSFGGVLMWSLCIIVVIPRISLTEPFEQGVYCMKLCLRGLGGNLCQCNAVHFAGKRLAVDEGTYSSSDHRASLIVRCKSLDDDQRTASSFVRRKVSLFQPTKAKPLLWKIQDFCFLSTRQGAEGATVQKGRWIPSSRQVCFPLLERPTDRRSLLLSHSVLMCKDKLTNNIPASIKECIKKGIE